MENKYYTPDLEDLYVGYECEVSENGSKFLGPMKINSRMIGGIDDFILSVRTPYLTKEQIESEGWEFKQHYHPRFEKTVNEVEYTIYIEYNQIQLYNFTDKHHILTTERKSINEFRKICKLLGI